MTDLPPGWGNDDPRYKRGYEDGESSGQAGYEAALMDLLPDDMDISPSTVAAYIERLQARGRRLVTRNMALAVVAHRFQKRWSLIEDPDEGWCWRRVVGGNEYVLPASEAEVQAVRDNQALAAALAAQQR